MGLQRKDIDELHGTITVRRAVVTKPVSDRHQPGSVFSRGEEWYAVSLFPGTTIDEGTTVVVADVERGLLVVYPTNDA